MSNANVVIVGAIAALVVIYFLPRLNTAARKAYGRWRRHRRDLRLERERRDREERLARLSRQTSAQ
ncbi:hypothetical protein [Caulobacter sp. BP25]|uniref:hypothetical protein n=1 Tax=Caulobacter sp. BP25 TaxID=2048900 RepID=UPI000C12C15A|nr:hypothetical protein [Caulobacter sp. BP25]PHY19821.1 hypothetical protein CSW59_09980 [Caulobacter sp. BP25]